MADIYPPFIDNIDTSLYPPDQFPWLYPSLFPDYWDQFLPPVDEPEPESTSVPEITPEPEPAAPADDVPVQGDDKSDTVLEIPQESDEPFPGDLLDAGDVMAVDLDVGSLAVVDAINGVRSELILISDQLADLQLSGDRPLLTTSFSDYTVTEGLLLLLLLCAFLSACYKLLRGGFQWLRS